MSVDFPLCATNQSKLYDGKRLGMGEGKGTGHHAEGRETGNDGDLREVYRLIDCAARCPPLQLPHKASTVRRYILETAQKLPPLCPAH